MTEFTHYLVEKTTMQNIFDYLNSRPAGEVLDLLNSVRQLTAVTMSQNVVNEEQVSS